MKKRKTSKESLNELTESEMESLIGGGEKVIKIGVIVNGQLIIVYL